MRPIDYIRTVAQSEGDERPYKGYVMRYMTSDQGERKPRHIIQTFDGGKVVGELNWYGTTGTIHHIEVEDGYYRQGIATAMWEWGQEMRPKPKHSGDRTTQGDAWARSVGGPIPRRNMASLHEAGSGPNSPEYRAAVEEHLAKAKAEGKADFGSTAEVRAYVERLLPPGVDVEVLVTHADRQGQMNLGAKAWVEKVNGRWRMSIKPEKAFKDVAVHEVAHIIDIETNGWPQGGGEGIDLEQGWAHGPSFQEALRELSARVGIRGHAARSGLLWHASPAKLPVGTVLVPSGPEGPESRTGPVNPGREDDKNWVWMADIESAYHYALKLSIRGREPYLYLVRPTSPVEHRSFDWKPTPVTKSAEIVAVMPMEWEDIRTHHGSHEVEGKTLWDGKGLMEAWKHAFEHGTKFTASADPTLDASFGTLREIKKIDGITYSFRTRSDGPFNTGAFVTATASGRKVGHINIGWQAFSPSGFVIQWVEVDQEHQRKGIASHMLEIARSHLAPWGGVRHDTTLSPSGRPWAEKVGAAQTCRYRHPQKIEAAEWMLEKAKDQPKESRREHMRSIANGALRNIRQAMETCPDCSDSIAMTAASTPRLFHGTPHPLPIGTVLVPGGPDDSLMNGGRNPHGRWVWMADSAAEAGGWAGDGTRANPGHVYEVEPIGEAQRLDGPYGTWIAPQARILYEVGPRGGRKTAGLRMVHRDSGKYGRRDHMTYEEQGTIPIEVVRDMPGWNGEVPHTHRNRKGERWEEFKADLAENGMHYGIFIMVNVGEPIRIWEGNHRRDAAVELGWDEIPVQIRYTGLAEQDGLLMERYAKGGRWMDGYIDTERVEREQRERQQRWGVRAVTSAELPRIQVMPLPISMFPPTLTGPDWRDRTWKSWSIIDAETDQVTGVVQGYEPKTQGEPFTIAWLHITPSYQRKGYASQAVNFLKHRYGDADYDSLTDEGARFWPSRHSAVGPSYQPFCVDCALERGFEHKDEAVPQRPSVDTCAACDQTKVCGYFRTGFNRDASSWRALVADAYWDAYDVTISSDGGASGRKAYEVHIGGKPYANRPSLAEAKLAVEQRFGAQDWRVVRVDKMTANHYHFGPTEEFTAPTTIWVADFA